MECFPEGSSPASEASPRIETFTRLHVSWRTAEPQGTWRPLPVTISGAGVLMVSAGPVTEQGFPPARDTSFLVSFVHKRFIFLLFN